MWCDSGSRLHQNPCTSASQVFVASFHLDRICSLWSTFSKIDNIDIGSNFAEALPVLRNNEAFWARSLKVLSKLRKLNIRAMLDHHCPTWPSEMLPLSQQQAQKFISTNICKCVHRWLPSWGHSFKGSVYKTFKRCLRPTSPLPWNLLVSAKDFTRRFYVNFTSYVWIYIQCTMVLSQCKIGN